MVILLAKDGDYGDYSGAGIPQVLRNLFDTVGPTVGCTGWIGGYESVGLGR